jgi:hypothetical protein
VALHCEEKYVGVFEIFEEKIMWSFVGLMEGE